MCVCERERESIPCDGISAHSQLVTAYQGIMLVHTISIAHIGPMTETLALAETPRTLARPFEAEGTIIMTETDFEPDLEEW